MAALRVLVFVVGAALVAAAASSAVRTFVVPRAVPSAISRSVFLVVRRLFVLTTRRATSYRAMDKRMAFYAPVSLLMLPTTWLAVLLVAFAAMNWALDGGSPWESVVTSGSSLMTLGFARPAGRLTTVLSFVEAGIGIATLALMITNLPAIYSAFTRREVFVSLLDVRAGTPPWCVTMLRRYQQIGLFHRYDELFERAEMWFADLEESHTSINALVFFRSPQPDRSWVTAAGTILDAAALSLAALDQPDDPHAALCIRAGFLCLRRIADSVGIAYEPDPAPDDPISISRAEFDAALADLVAVGTAVKADREQAWRDFAGWRVNYDSVLLQLAALCQAPPAPWSSDRAPR